MKATQLTRDNEPFNKLGFWALIMTQFQGAFSDNVYKIIILLYLPVLMAQRGVAESQENSTTWLATALFNLPWLLFPAIAGALADRFSKKRVTVWTKLWEVGVMGVGLVAILLGSPWLLLAMLFMMAMQSTFFSPAKYGILPEILPESRLSWGNGLLNLMTFVAIILGNVAGAQLLEHFKDRMYIAMGVLVAISCLGVLCSLFVTPSRPAEPMRQIPLNPYKNMGHYLKMFRDDRWLYLTMVGIAYFWFAGAIVLQNVTELGLATLTSDAQRGYLMAIMALGIGLGSFAAGYLSRGRIEMRLVPVGLCSMGVFCFLLALPGLGYVTTLAGLFFLGFSAGLYDVPLAAMLQQRSPNTDKGGMISTSNFVTFSAMMVAALLFFVLFNKAGFSPQGVFLVTGVLTLAISVYLILCAPIFRLRKDFWFVGGVPLRIRGRDANLVPATGPALLVGNHISLVDVLAVASSNPRGIYFVADEGIFESRDLSWSIKRHQIIPVPSNPDADMGPTIAAIRERLEAGDVVCVNTEDRFAPDGPRLPWYDNFNVLVEGLGCPVVPFHMTRLWESLYIVVDGEIQWRRPAHWNTEAVVQYGPASSGTLNGWDIREEIQRIGMAAYMERSHPYKLLHEGFVRAARRHLRRTAVSDATSGELNYFKALVGSIAFARKLKTRVGVQPMVGLLLPPSVGGALANIALQLLGRTPVNLNYTSSAETLASCARQCDLSHILTSRKFIEKLPLAVPGEAVYLEDIKELISGKDRIAAMVLGLAAPLRLIERLLGAPPRTEDDLATVIFSSGSEGEPKGVLLTHRNIVGNIEGALEVFPHNKNTCLVGYLPFFHSFGHMATLWMPLCRGLAATFHPNPLEPKIIGGLVQKHKGTIMIGTSTLLQGFIRRCTSEQMESLGFVVCGAEKLAPRVRTAFLEKFGVEPLEGYGTTECSPGVSVNIPDCVSPGFYFRGTKHGTIGRPIPGQCLRVVDPDTGEEKPLLESGMLLVKGVNIMKGYMHQPEKTATVLQDGWYATGDIAHLDEDHFTTITDRLSRFSKIGGEMVPHTKVEETLHSLLSLTEQSLAVASAPDMQKGERLIVLHILTDEQLDLLLKSLDKSGLPNLWIPKPNAFYRIAEIPVLGTGKMDIRTVKKMAQSLDLGE